VNYEFPRIVHISQVLEAIEGDEDLFYVVEKEGYTVINYKLPCNKTFPAVVDRNTAIRRELRGIKFDNITGEILARPFHKFHNYGEREETLAANVDLSVGYDRLEKLDGSMVHPLFLNGNFRWSTKMGITNTSMQTETWLARDPQQGLSQFIKECWNERDTPIFEWCSRQNRIVVDHPVDRLVLTAVRNNYSGEYYRYEDLEAYGSYFDIEVVAIDTTSIKDMKSYSESIYEIKSDTITEGEVLRFHDGHMLKLKTQDYVNLHRTKDKIQKERNLVAVLLASQLDDLKPFMLKEDLAKAEAYENQLSQNVADICASITREANQIVSSEMSRKDFALNSKADPFVRQIIFQLWDKNFPVDIISDEVMKRLTDACEHEQKFERLKSVLLKGCVW
jgi:RNA ligase